MEQIKRIIISRTDSIGDVILTLPLCGILKNNFPDVEIYFLGKNYVKDIIESSVFINRFISYDQLLNVSKQEQITTFKKLNADVIIHVFPNKKVAKIAKKSKIPIRIGTSHRIFHLFTCNRKVKFSRRKSDLHEAQLNTKLLYPLNIDKEFSLNELSKFYGLKNIKPLKKELSVLIDTEKFNLILHPKSKGSAREWGLENFERLINLLPQKNFKIFITGTEQEGNLMSDFLERNKDKITDLSGKMSLSDLISFINSLDALVAASTGPLHIAAALGKHALGIYAPMKPIHPGRWKPVGTNASVFVVDKECNKCKKGGICECIMDISPLQIAQKLQTLL
ncbi:MAG: glycosyltransferase family 9 protein [Bacteroidales bacterium]|nr:glycosyltransferase family 9 protein [Bacteroidales bacterium]